MCAAHANVLLVEDDAPFARALSVGLGSDELTVTTSGDAIDALNRIDRGHPVDLLLCDLRLAPGQPQGFALARMARQRLPALRVIFLTGFEVADQEAEDAAGPILQKPLDLQAVRTEIALALSQPPRG